MDFLVVATVCFRLLYVWFVIDHGSRRVLHFNVTTNPTASWVIQQIREAFPGESAHDYLIYDNDAIFSDKVTEAIEHFGIEPMRTSLRSPWQNGTAERWVGSVRRELLDHVIVFDDQHLQRLLRDYVTYYNADRVHTRPRDSPHGRPMEIRPTPYAQVVGLPRVGGLIEQSQANGLKDRGALRLGAELARISHQTCRRGADRSSFGEEPTGLLSARSRQVFFGRGARRSCEKCGLAAQASPK